MNHTPKRCNFVLNLQLFFPVFSWLSFCQPTGVAWNCCVNGWQRSDLSRWCIAARQCGRTSVGSQDGALAVALPYGRMQIDQLHNDLTSFAACCPAAFPSPYRTVHPRPPTPCPRLYSNCCQHDGSVEVKSELSAHGPKDILHTHWGWRCGK